MGPPLLLMSFGRPKLAIVGIFYKSYTYYFVIVKIILPGYDQEINKAQFN
jgi:hypothetical protein